MDQKLKVTQVPCNGFYVVVTQDNELALTKFFVDRMQATFACLHAEWSLWFEGEFDRASLERLRGELATNRPWITQRQDRQQYEPNYEAVQKRVVEFKVMLALCKRDSPEAF